MLKIIGYLLSIIGLAALALSINGVRKIISITLPGQLNNTFLTIAGIIFLIIGVFIAMKNPSSASKHAEVPIYQGNQIVGYRRV